MGPRLLAAVLAFAGALCWPAGAGAAATLYANPDGTGSACTAAAPCDLSTAVFNANTGDTVIVQSGTYQQIGGVGNSKGITVAGASPRPVIALSSSAQLQLSGPGAVLQDVEVDGSGPGDAFTVTGTVSRVIGRTRAMGAAGCGLYGDGSVIRDSLCLSSAGPGLGLSANGGGLDSLTARNVTAIGTEGIFAGAGYFGSMANSVNATVVNSIVRSTSGTSDIVASVAPAGTGAATVETIHCNYSTTIGSVTDDGTNQQAMPAFLNAPAGDYHEAPGSPTVGAGTSNGVQAGETDLDGNPRTLGTATDIGAYQYFPPVLSTLPVTAITTSGATLNGSIARRGSSGTAQFELGVTSAYGLTLSGVPVPEGSGTVPMSTMVSGLPPNTLFHYRVDYAVGSTTFHGKDGTFRTASPPAPRPPVLSRVGESHRLFREGSALASLSRVLRAPVGTTFSFTLNEPAAVTLAFTKSSTRGGRCTGRHTAASPGCRPSGTLIFAAHAGANRVKFQGRLARTDKLGPGKYTVTITASSGSRRSKPHTLRFTIIR